MSIKTYLFDADGPDCEVELCEATVEGLNHRKLLWVDVQSRDKSDISAAARILNLRPETVHALISFAGRPRVYNYGVYFQFGLVALNRVGKEYKPVPIDFICGPNYVITVHKEEVSFLEDFRQRDRADTDIGALESRALLASMLDWHLSVFFRVVEALEVEDDKLDEKVLTRTVDKNFLNELVRLRRQVSRLRRLLFPQRAVFHGLTRPDFVPETSAAARDYYQILNERFERATDAIENAGDLVRGSFEIFTSRAAESTTNIVRLLAFLTLLLGASTLVTGVFGMNFEIPFFQSGWSGFFGVIGTSAVLLAGISYYARRRKWF